MSRFLPREKLMHIPDGLLDLKAASATAGLAATGLWAALRRLREGLPRRRIPLMGLAAAFVFAAQLVNFPVAGGSSGHLLGAVLSSVLLGPSAAVVTMTAVILVQCLLFADGGLLALGANVQNMAVVAVLGGHAVYRTLRRALPGPRGLLLAAAFAAWCSTLLASIACAAELAWSGVAPWRLVFPAMASVHMLIGVGEALITTLVLASLLRARPDLLDPGPSQAPGASRHLLAAGFAAACGVALFGPPLASSRPDGLEHVAQLLGLAASTSRRLPAPLADDRFPGLASAATAASLAGLAGTLVVFALAHALATALAPRDPS